MSFATAAPVTPLDTLLMGYQTGVAPQAVNNSDSGAAQESQLFLSPTQLAKGEEILRINICYLPGGRSIRRTQD